MFLFDFISIYLKYSVQKSFIFSSLLSKFLTILWRFWCKLSIQDGEMVTLDKIKKILIFDIDETSVPGKNG